MTQLIVNRLYKSFGEQIGLREVSFNASGGDIVTVLGHSGSGKSTLLRCINQLEVPDTGSVQLDGMTLDYTPETEARKHALTRKTITQLRSKVAMVFQQFHLWEHMTILQNLIEAPICVLKKTKQQATEHAETLLARMGILNKRNHFPAQLSGGQQQRAAIARALMMNPKVMLLDEPTSALDPEMVSEVIKIVLSLAEQGMIVIVSTHEIGFARQIAKQVVFMSDGQVVENGIGSQLFKCPQSEQFKRFLASVHHYSGEHVD